MEKFILIDGNSLLNRAYYATPVFTTKEGMPTNGVFGFIKLMLKIISDKQPSYLAVAFDLHSPTFRHKLYDGYKAGRKPMPSELAVQMPVLKEVLKLMNIRICEMQGYEADDIIGTLSKRFDVHSSVYTGDRDSYQLVSKNTNVCYTRKGVSDILELTAENFQDEVGLTPSQIIDLKSLMGDKSDNIPGVAGVGEKSAYGLLGKYGDLDGVYAHLDEITGAIHKKLEENKEIAYFSKQLATIDVNAPIDVALSECMIKMPFSLAVKEKFSELEFKSLLTKDIFENEDKRPENQEEKPQSHEVEEILLESVLEGINVLKNQTIKAISVEWSDDGFRFFAYDNQTWAEYFLPIKTGLLDVGVYEYQLEPLLRTIFEGKIRTIAYNVKEVMHRLTQMDVGSSAPYEDVGILKCLAEGLSTADSLEFLYRKSKKLTDYLSSGNIFPLF